MGSVSDHGEAAQEDVDAITKVALDYIEGYVSGDAQRHARSYHPEAIKRRYTQDEAGIFGIISLSPQTMADYAATQTDTDQGGSVEVVIDDVFEDIATVRVYSPRWVDFLHVVKARGEWRLFHITWHDRERSVPES